MNKGALAARIFLLGLGLVLLAGCKSPEPPAGVDNLAWVEVAGTHSFLEVARATSEVFQQAGYRPVPQPKAQTDQDPKLVFEKQGSKGDALLYGDWMGSVIWYRAKVMFTSKGPSLWLLRLDAYRVTNRGDKAFEQETKLSRRGPYQELLDKVKARLQEAGGGAEQAK